MAPRSLVLIAGLIFLVRYEAPETNVEFSNAQIILWTGVLISAPVLIAYLIRKLTDFRPIIALELLGLVGYICLLHLLHLPGFINKNAVSLEIVHHSREFLSLIPLFIGLLCIRLIMLEMPLRPSEQQWEFINFNFRSLALPLIPLLIFNVVLDLIYLLPETIQPFIFLGVLVPLIMLPFVMAPLMMQFLWKTKPLTNITLKQKLDQLTERSGMKYRAIAVLQTGGLGIANAAVAGIIPRNRKIFITDALLRNFTDEQIETIVAHEIGHIHHRHLLFSCFLVFGYLASAVLFSQLVSDPLSSLLDGVPILLPIVSLLFFLFYFKVFFNFLSRRFEHQADLYAVDLTNNPEAFKSALENLGFLSGLPKTIRFVLEIFNTHPPIEKRIKFIDQSTEDNPYVDRYRRCLLEVKALFALIQFLVFFIFLINR